MYTCIFGSLSMSLWLFIMVSMAMVIMVSKVTKFTH